MIKDIDNNKERMKMVSINPEFHIQWINILFSNDSLNSKKKNTPSPSSCSFQYYLVANSRLKFFDMEIRKGNLTIHLKRMNVHVAFGMFMNVVCRISIFGKCEITWNTV